MDQSNVDKARNVKVMLILSKVQGILNKVVMRNIVEVMQWKV